MYQICKGVEDVPDNLRADELPGMEERNANMNNEKAEAVEPVEDAGNEDEPILPEPEENADGEEASIMAESVEDAGSAVEPAEDAGNENEPITENVLGRWIRDDPRRQIRARHLLWLDSLQHEYPLPYHPYKIGVYVRYFNQTRYGNYLEKHIQQFTDDIALCKRWTLVDFYIDKGPSAPKMENSREWCRLLGDCFSGKIDLILTQKVSNISSDPDELSFIVRILAAQKHPVGIYFLSENIFTSASYYRQDMLDKGMFPPGFKPLPDDELDGPMIYEGDTRGRLTEGLERTENGTENGIENGTDDLEEKDTAEYVGGAENVKPDDSISTTGKEEITGAGIDPRTAAGARSKESTCRHEF